MEPWRLTFGGVGGSSLGLGAYPRATEAHLGDKVIQLEVIESSPWSHGVVTQDPWRLTQDPWRLMRE